MAETISWVATIATIVAALMTASNLGARITGYGFCMFLVGSLSWLANGIMTGQPALSWTNAVLTLLNILGIWRWLGRQARVEEGARQASAASVGAPGEALFPVSMLTRGAVRCGDEDVGNCVEAMAGCRSGRLAYVVVSEGGVAGVGERFRRLPWESVEADGDGVTACLSAEEFGRLEELAPDDWSGR